MKKFTLSVEDAEGPIQLILMDDKKGIGIRLLGSKGSPHKTIIKKWILTEDQLKNLVNSMKEILGEQKGEK